jgi:hypothetical protein
MNTQMLMNETIVRMFMSMRSAARGTSPQVLARFLFVTGHTALETLLYAEKLAVEGELIISQTKAHSYPQRKMYKAAVVTRVFWWCSKPTGSRRTPSSTSWAWLLQSKRKRYACYRARG